MWRGQLSDIAAPYSGGKRLAGSFRGWSIIRPMSAAPLNFVEGRLTVLFEDPFWVGIFERSSPDGYSAARLVLGAEPADADLYQIVLQRFIGLRFSQPSTELATDGPPREINFKRRQRQARILQVQARPGARARQALHAELERNKKTRKETGKAEQDALESHKFHVRQEKHKEKHRGH
jgi:hypothetical protein